MPGQLRTRASKVSPSITWSTSAGWPVRIADTDGRNSAAAVASLTRPAPVGAISTPAVSPAAKAAAVNSNAPPRAGWARER
jgi:hypothetical protein